MRSFSTPFNGLQTWHSHRSYSPNPKLEKSEEEERPGQSSPGNVLIEVIQYRDMKVPLVTITSQNQFPNEWHEMTCYPSCHWSSVGDFAENQVIGKFF